MTKEKRIALRLTQEELEILLKINKNISNAVRILINSHKKAQK